VTLDGNFRRGVTPLMRSTVGVGAFYLVLVCSAALPGHAAAHPWLDVRSPHFRVITDAGEQRGIEVARHCEQMRAAFAVLMSRATVETPAPLLIFALKNQKEVDEFAQGRGTRGRHSGMFLPGADRSFILVDASDDPWHTIFHEYAHELLHANTSSAVQTWFEEGFAEYFSTLHATDKTTELGEVPLAELQFLRQKGQLMRLADLMQVNQKSAVYSQSGVLQAVFYAQSWLLVHYLFDHQQISKAQSFFSMIEAGFALDNALHESFGMGTAQLESELLAYARGEKFRYFSLPTRGLEKEVSIRELNETTVSALKLQLRWRGDHEHTRISTEELARAYSDLVSRNGSDAEALRGFGSAQLELGDFSSSLESLRRAVHADPLDVLNHHAMAKLLNAMDSSGMGAAHRGFSAREEAENCTKLDPHFADAYRQASIAMVREGHFDRALQLIHNAVALRPRAEDYKLELAGLELKQRDYASAVDLLQRLKNSRDPEVVKKADYFLSAATTEQLQAAKN
jgi:tetratricopeptide (TPR) repeat protein